MFVILSRLDSEVCGDLLNAFALADERYDGALSCCARIERRDCCKLSQRLKQSLRKELKREFAESADSQFLINQKHTQSRLFTANLALIVCAKFAQTRKHCS